MNRRCTICKEEKDVLEFGKKSTYKDGLSPWCKVCKSIKDKEYHISEKAKANRKEKYSSEEWKKNRNRKLKDHLKSNPKIKLLAHARARAKKYGLAFNITQDDIDIPELCPVLNIKLQIGDGKFSNNSPTIDRIDSSKGYIKGNVAIISWRANHIKSNATIWEIEQLIEYMKKGTRS